jgi:hypothetical protein
MKPAAVVILLLSGVAFSNCGSPEKYQKQGIEVEGQGPDISVTLGLPQEYGPWAQAFSQAMQDARDLHDLGNVPMAVRIADSLIAGAERSLDTLPFHDPRARFLYVMLTDAYPQSIAWRLERGDTADARIRTEKYQALGARVSRLRDSIGSLP